MKGIIRKIKDGVLLLELDKNVYELEAIFQAVYRFTDTCYIYIEPVSDEIMGVYFKSKGEANSELEKISDSFCNELIDQQVRLIVQNKCGHIRDEIVKKAFSPINR